METIIEIITLISLFVLDCCLWYRFGYNKREQEFQDKPIQFTVGNEAACRVYRENSGLKIKIYNKKLVEIVEVE